jgi:hypothetical protein
MQLGMAHMGDLLDRFDGSYVLVIAAYNAGSGRIDQWVREMGDPRKKNVDPVDWIERIPFTETRNYVQRVLENTMVYRHRISGAPMSYTLAQDLRRTSATPLDLSYTTRKGAKKPAAEPPPIEQITPPEGAPAEPEPVDPKAPPTPTMDHDGPAVPPRSGDLGRAPGPSGLGSTGATGQNDDVPLGAFLPPGCKTFILRPNGAAECIDQTDNGPSD